MHSVGDEFVIRIGEEYLTSGAVGSGNETVKSPDYLYRMEGFNSLVFDENGLDRLDQLTDDYINEHYGMFQDAAYQKGLADAWEAAKNIVLEVSEGGYNYDQLCEMFDFDVTSDIFTKYTASEALERIREYEEKQKAKEKQKAEEEIEIGDEVLFPNSSGQTMVVCHIAGNRYTGISENGTRAEIVMNAGNLVKTGRHFPQIAEVLEQMKEGESNV